MLPISIAPSPVHADRTIAVTRILLAAVCLLAVYVDPAQPSRFAGFTYALLSLYTVYAALIAVLVWNRPNPIVALATHGFDILAFSVFQYLTLGPSSPFFVYFIFSLFCGTIRWGWRGTMWTAAAVTVSFLAIAVSMSHTLGAIAFELNRFIIRVAYLAAASVLLVYLSRHETALREQIGRLAHWPRISGLGVETAMAQVLESAGEIVGAGRVMAIWRGGEPWTFKASWVRGGTARLTRHVRSPLDALPDRLAGATFVSSVAAGVRTIQVLTEDGTLQKWTSELLPPGLLPEDGGAVLSAPFAGDHVAGRLFLADLDRPAAEITPVAEAVARAVAASVEQMEMSERQREIAVFRERLRLARDLHDGVLQSLMGIRLELQAAAVELSGPDADRSRRRLMDLERALAFEQRELRLFIDSLRPAVQETAGSTPLADRLEAVKQRIALEWTAAVSLRVRDTIPLSPAADQAVPLMVHEAIVNALKHGGATHIRVDVACAGSQLRIVVEDNGRGFPFEGCFDHAMLTGTGSGPVSLRDRAASLGGTLSIESTRKGARVELRIPPAEEVECRSA